MFFADAQNLVGLDVFDYLNVAREPMNLELIGLLRLPKAKMDSTVAVAPIAPAPDHRPSQLLPADRRDTPHSDWRRTSRSVGESKEKPVTALRLVVQQCWAVVCGGY